MTEPAATSSTAPATSNGLAIAALIVGIVAGILGWIPFAGLVAGIVAIVLGVLALRKGQSKVLAIVGIVLGAGAGVVSLFFTIAFVGLGALSGNA
jgi:hypothetical protein